MRREMECEKKWRKEMKEMRDRSDKYNDDDFWRPKERRSPQYASHTQNVNIRSSGRIYSDNYEDGKLAIEQGRLNLDRDKFHHTPGYIKGQVISARFVADRTGTFLGKFMDMLFNLKTMALMVIIPIILLLISSFGTAKLTPEFYAYGFISLIIFEILIVGCICFCSAHLEAMTRVRI